MDRAASLSASAEGAGEQAPSFVERLSESDRRALSMRGHRVFYPTGAVICQEGESGDAMYIVERGSVAVLKEMSNGHSAVLGSRGEGEVLGEMSLVSQQPRFASLIAEEDTELLRISAADFPELMDEYPGISWAILNVLNDRLHAADVARTTISQVEQKLARRVRRLTTEAEHQADVARKRQETVELIVHDLRTPVTVIDGCLQLLRSAIAEESWAANADIIELAKRSSEQISTLLDALLEAARQEEMDLPLVRRPVDLVEIIDLVTRTMAPMAAESGIDLSHDVPLEMPVLRGDPDRLERVLLNLLENAVSYTPDGGRVVVAASLSDGEVEVGVVDTGPGVPVEYRLKIFDRFVRVPGVQGRRKGFGLGLYFCRQVVQAHGGRIWVEPGPQDAGSRFAFTLPLREMQEHV